MRSLEEIGQRLDELADELGLPELVGLAEDLASYLEPPSNINAEHVNTVNILGGSISAHPITANQGQYLVVTNNGLTMSNGSVKVGP